MQFDMMVTDLDDTLLSDNQEISPYTRRMIEILKHKGLTVVLASGRMPRAIAAFHRALKLDTPVIACNGSWVGNVHTRALLWEKHLPPSVVPEVVAMAQARDCYVQLHDSENYYFESYTAQTAYYEKICRLKGQAVGDLFTFIKGKTFLKILVVDAPDKTPGHYHAISQAFSGKINCFISKPRYVEVTHPQADKGEALKFVAGHLGIDLARVLAFGDALNDIAMLQAAGYGVCMENGAPKAKAVAKAIAPPNTQDGVAVMLHKLFLEERA